MMKTRWRRAAIRLAVLSALAAMMSPDGSLAESPLPISHGANSAWEDFAPFVYGDKGPEVVVFTAPSCPYCRQLLDYVPTLAERYRVIILPIWFTGYDAQRIRAMACAKNPDAAARSLLLHQDVVLPQREPCDVQKAIARYEEAQRRGVAAVPTIIRSDGQVSQGLRPDLVTWLAQGAKP